MKTSRILAALVTLTATAAVAGIKLETRTDFKNVTFNDDAGQKGYTNTSVNRARLNVNHKVSDELSVYSRLDLLATGTATDKTGAASNFIDHAYVGYTFFPSFTLTMGKLAAIGGGMENQYNAGDLYLTSQLLTADAPANAGGVGLTYAMGDHTFDLQFTNDDQTATAASGATRTMAGAQYYGNFMDKKLQVIASYHNMKYAKVVSGSLDSKPITKSVVGVKYDAGFAMFDLDYGMVTDEYNSTVADKKNSTTGFVFNAAVPFMEKCKVIVKAENTTKKVNDDKSDTYSNFGLAYEHKMGEESNMHIAYNMLSDKVESSGLTSKENQLFVGFKVYADIMK